MAEYNGNGVARWGMLASWAAVILALVFGIGGAIGAAIGLALQDTRLAVKGLQERELANAKDSGRLMERIDNHGAALVKLDEVLQREMRILDDAIEAKIMDLDHRLQGEIARAAAVGAEDRQGLRAELAQIRMYQDGARERNADQDARLKAMERMLFDKKPP